MVNNQVGFRQIDDFIHYFVNGMPVYCHEKDDKNGYRFVLATLVNNKFCQIKELSEEKIKQAQELLDNGESQLKTAKKVGVSESAVRYHLKSGKLKKKSSCYPHEIFFYSQGT